METNMKRTVLTVAALLLTTSLFAAPRTPAPQPVDLTSQFQSAGAIERLQAFELGGVVIIRGRTYDRLAAAEAGRIAANLGYTRVANLVQILDRPDDSAIERAAEIELTMHPSLDGSQLRIRSLQGVVHLDGRVRHELQKDVAIQLVRNIAGVSEVRADLHR
jgi:osmotically-inducible protein OsmY